MNEEKLIKENDALHRKVAELELQARLGWSRYEEKNRAYLNLEKELMELKWKK